MIKKEKSKFTKNSVAQIAVGLLVAIAMIFVFDEIVTYAKNTLKNLEQPCIE